MSAWEKHNTLRIETINGEFLMWEEWWPNAKDAEHKAKRILKANAEYKEIDIYKKGNWVKTITR